MVMDNVVPKLCHWVLELHGHCDIFFFGINRSGPGTSSIANYKCDMALGQLHGPWCKHPMMTMMMMMMRMMMMMMMMMNGKVES
jgi:hypothetical protein